MTNNTRPKGAETQDFIAAMLRTKRVPPLHAVLTFEDAVAPPPPLGPPEGLICRSNGTFATRKRWPDSVHKLAEKFPGYQPGHDMRERMKYDDMPDKDTPLMDYVLKRLNHARAVWSAKIDAKPTRLQFDEWLPLHLDFQTLVTPLWPDGYQGPNDGWALSFQFLRLACELPRYPAWRSAA